MNQDQVKGSWEAMMGRARDIWPKLTEDDINQAKGLMDNLVGTIQTKFGDAKEDVRRKLAELTNQLF